MAGYMQLRNKIIKMGVLHESGCKWLRKSAGVSESMDKVALFFLFVIGCYFPVLILSIIYTLFIAAPSGPQFDPKGYGYSTPDQKQVLDILQACRKI